MRSMKLGFCPLLMLAACGSDGPGDPDATAAALDAPAGSIDAAGDTAVNVTVFRNGGGAPEAGVRVIIHGADGAVVRETITGGDGTVRLDDVPAGGAVTTWPRRQTILDVHPGDELMFGSPIEPVANPQLVGFMHVTHPLISGATQYFAWLGCRSNLGTGEVVNAPIYNNTPSVAPLAVVVPLADGTTASAVLPTVSVSDGANITIDSFDTPHTAQPIAITNLPAGVRQVSVDSRADCIRFGTASQNGAATSMTGSFSLPTGFGSDFEHDVRVFGPQAQEAISSIDAHLAAQTSITMDAQARLLPWPSTIVLAGRELTVTTAWTASGHDRVTVSIPAASSSEGVWSILGGSLSVHVPELPADLAPDVDLSGVIGVGLSDSDVVDGWAAARSLPTDGTFTAAPGRTVRSAFARPTRP